MSHSQIPSEKELSQKDPNDNMNVKFCESKNGKYLLVISDEVKYYFVEYDGVYRTNISWCYSDIDNLLGIYVVLDTILESEVMNTVHKYLNIMFNTHYAIY